jgi:hypothetical protein
MRMQLTLERCQWGLGSWMVSRAQPHYCPPAHGCSSVDAWVVLSTTQTLYGSARVVGLGGGGSARLDVASWTFLAKRGSLPNLQCPCRDPAAGLATTRLHYSATT